MTQRDAAPMWDAYAAELLEDRTIQAASALNEELTPDPAHARQVCGLALALFESARKIHGFDGPERRVLACAALLHDTGLSQDALKHHKRSRDIILDAKLPDFTKLERKMAACVARYHRKAAPDPKHKHFRDLTRREQRVVTHLAALLRLADGLDRAHIGSVSGLTLENGRGVFRVEAAQRTLSPTDVWGSMRKRGLLEEVLGLPVEVHAVDPSPAAQRS